MESTSTNDEAEYAPINANQTLSVLACESINERLKRIGCLLPLAALHAEDDPEHVHQLRVATRHALAAIETFAKLLEIKDDAWLLKKLKRIRAAAGGARDLDVLRNRFASSNDSERKEVDRYLQRKRRIAQRPLIKLHARLNHHSKFATRATSSLESARHKSNVEVSVWVMHRVHQAALRFMQSQPKDHRDGVAFHHFRVKAKQLRYTLELADELGSTELKTELYPLICDVQQRLGDLNDHVVAARLLSQLCHEAKTRRCASLLRKLSEKEARKATRKRKRFLRWWSEKRSGQCVEAFSHYS